ncbi:tRNA uridine-5-carboxymethylaminomethyl(34) synthesis GTPase MnmE [Candidatus Igneacidithiobacillus taiwanensis]|uniref:tRNA uridine-5-carboxymethylaminomethyl(34) synthesis GTPase MnmE n=1 Tax=Candidatus Igneacidithiobacillus taiwanensis TaxID=1945924 RepID=UPI00289F03C2|nr:tRNA uridine-5-carboxymethylaminomethyl(34) synthesis GTPase MnmE [Candidatus Igneacidithiobacillus taiwanensis]MCE5359638.1 tRNA uridine-5-carboxymethylaminomethyl(34) synthesis GTPase MnmE [Acidithiobacillus sp.]
MPRADGYQLGDSIVALATAAGEAGIGVLRLSGPRALAIANILCGLPAARSWRPRHAYLRAFYGSDGELLDRGIALYFPAPHSYTGEDVVELQGHGSPVLLEALLAAAVAQGARLARPGEFTERAFLHGRLDLAQAEAVADLIHARSRSQARAALASLEGRFSEGIDALRQQILGALALAEAGLDFSEEDLGEAHMAAIAQQLQGVQQQLQTLLQQSRQGAKLGRGARVALLGRPNVGKSSLLNALAGRDTAIITPIAGTTRDILREEITLNGLPVELLDTAGLRQSDDPVEQEGVRRSRALLARVDWVLLLLDASSGWQAEDATILAELDAQRCTLLWNKVDLLPAFCPPELGPPSFGISARTGAGLADLRAHLRAVVGGEDSAPYLARQRHVLALEAADNALQEAAMQLHAGAEELVAQGLRDAAAALGQITGAVDVEEILGEIFSRFCIGK